METSFSSLLVTFMFNVAILAGIPLAVATLSGFVVSFIQAVTQIQDQTLGQTVKISSVVLILLIYGAALSGPLMTSTIQIFEEFSELAK